MILTSSHVDRAETACESMRSRFGVALLAAAAGDRTSLDHVLEGANIILATGAAGVELLHEDAWKDLPELKILMGANATPPLGIQGVDMNNRARITASSSTAPLDSVHSNSKFIRPASRGCSRPTTPCSTRLKFLNWRKRW